MATRKDQQAELLTALGYLLAPLKSLSDQGSTDRTAWNEAIARLRGNLPAWNTRVTAFTDVGRARYFQQERVATAAPETLENSCHRLLGTGRWDRIYAAVVTCEINARNAILDVPIDEVPGILADSPFRVYLTICSLLSTARKRADWVDPYLTAEVFTRYLHHLQEDVDVTLLRHESKGAKPAFVQASTVFSTEPRKGVYRMLLSSNLHDRWLRVDDTIYVLGGTAVTTHAAVPFTISSLGTDPTSHAKIDAELSSAIEWFGPTVRPHRTQ